jgi:uncharacterized protein involved in exopolysaccharide biosynthesis
MRTDIVEASENILAYESAAPGGVQEIDFRRYLLVLRRRWLSFVLTTVLLFSVAVVVALRLPSVYEASAKILVESQLIPTDLTESTVTANAIERVMVIEQRLMTRDTLLEIVNKFDLYRQMRSRMPLSDVVDIMRKAVDIAPIDVPQAGSVHGGAIGFTVSFDYDDPDIAARVTNELVALILQQNIQSRTGQAAQTAKFFQEQSDRLAQDLADLEAQIADFKRKNGASLPDSLPYRRTLLLQLQSQLAELDQKIALADRDQEHPGGTMQVRRLNIHLDAARQQLESVTKERDSMKSLVDKGLFPKNRLIDLDRTAATMQADIDTTLIDIDAAKRQAAESNDGSGAGAAAVARLSEQREQLAQSISDLNSSILTTPEVEATLETLTRDHDNLQVRYRDAMAKAAAAATNEDLEQSRQAERFEVIEQATPPTKPVKAMRMKILLGGGLASGAAGVGVLVARELFDRRLRTAADIERRLQIRAISVIPYLPIPVERTKKRLRSMVLALFAAGAIVAILALVHFQYTPSNLFMAGILAQMSLR